MLSADTRNRVNVALASTAAGAELLSGFVPTFGTVYYVDPTTGNDTVHDGLSMDKPFATIAHAYDKVTSNANDVIVLSAYAAHDLDDEIIVAKNLVHFVGLDPAPGRYIGQRARITMGLTTGSAIAAIQVTGKACSFTNIKFESTDSLSTSLYAVADGGEFTVFTNCHFRKAEDLNQTTAADLLCNGDSSYYNHCFIGDTTSAVSVARGNILFTRETITGKVARDVMFEDCIIAHKCTATTTVHAKTTGATDIERMCLFKNCTFWNDVLSTATQALVFGIGAALTTGMILLQDSWSINVTDTCATAQGVYTTASAPTTTGGEAVLTATT